VTQVLCHNVAAKVLHYFLPRLRMSQAIMLLIVRATVPIMALLAAIIAAVRNDTGEHFTATAFQLLLRLLTVPVLDNSGARCFTVFLKHSE
jgi:Na+/proline symporter